MISAIILLFVVRSIERFWRQPLSQVRIQPQSRLLSGRRKKALFVSPSPDTASKGAKGIYETPEKFRVKKTGEISRNLPFFRRLACQTAVFLVRIDFDHTTWQGQEDSNPRPTVLETGTLPAELYPCATPVL